MTNEGAKEQSGDVLQQLVDALQQSQEDQAGHGSSPHPGRRGSSLRVTCWECKEKGHRRRCPKRRSRPAETFPVGKQALAELAGQSLASNFETPKNIFKTGSIYSVADNLTVSGTGQWEGLSNHRGCRQQYFYCQT